MLNPTDFPNPTLISVNGVELEVFEAGRQHAGNPIVLCHGWPEHAFAWRYQVPALVKSRLSRHRSQPTGLWQLIPSDRSNSV
ncbi:MAG: hypothetical protein R2932_38265 [Caldilineaceae bacterium]